jgi:hypothetical protein
VRNVTAMESRVRSLKPRSKSGGFLYESGVRPPREFESLTIPPFNFGHLGQFDHFVVTDAGSFAVPKAAHAAACPMRIFRAECIVHSVEHVAATAPAMAGDFRDEVVSERNVRHFRARECG